MPRPALVIQPQPWALLARIGVIDVKTGAIKTRSRQLRRHQPRVDKEKKNKVVWGATERWPLRHWVSLRNVRYWHLADICFCTANVRSWPKADIAWSDHRAVPPFQCAGLCRYDAPARASGGGNDAPLAPVAAI